MYRGKLFIIKRDKGTMKQDYGKNRILIGVALIMLASLLLPGGEELLGKRHTPAEQTYTENNSEESISDSFGTEYMTVIVYVGGQNEGTLAATGSGVILDMSQETMWIVTAGHVLERAASNNDITVGFGKDAKVRCSIYEIMQDADLAFIGIESADLSDDIRSKCAAAQTDKESYDALKASDRVYVSGYRDDENVKCEGVLFDPWIMVEDFGQYMMVADCEIYSGMSGGGLFDASDMLIGIVCGGDEQGSLAAVPFHVVWAQFENMRHNS